ncbi:CpaF family protein [uncultured Kiloniella sp.]|uniref:CpaF family protein n=1 Tax=uncultured Kiloniella sp. TaxID=1133091 RepID=UPI00262DE2FA|nr:CpaF family protein [uncultured Kiloniella sp.]
MQHEQNTEQADGNQQDEQFKALLKSKLADKPASVMSRPELSLKIGQIVTEELENQSSEFNLLQRRALITNLINWYVTDVRKEEENQTEAEVVPVPSLSKFESRPYPINKPKQPNTNTEQQASSASGNIEEAKSIIQPKVMDRLDISAASKLPKEELSSQLGEIVGEILFEDKLRLNAPEKSAVIELILADMLGLGPLEPLLADEGITDIMVNGPNQVYIEKGGKLQLTDVVFRDNDHVMNVARRIVAHVGRRVDETTPLCDARLADGSRVNIIIPPLAIDGSSISIRKFAKQNITLDIMKKQKNISPEMATVMKIASRSRLNILISGGTGSGKTTLLNALSQMIDHGERIVTIEDAAELQLQQPHVVRLETRPPNLEGEGAITMRDLVKNSLRMRPDRIILGEIRGSEAVDMLQAMNTGHDGSLGTVHANRPREALTRLENMVGMAGINLPAKAVRTQIADALDMIIQVSRMRDGMRRITHVTEVIGMEGDIVTTQDLFTFNFLGEDKDGNLTGEFKSTGLRPFFFPKAEYFSLGKHLMDAMG